MRLNDWRREAERFADIDRAFSHEADDGPEDEVDAPQRFDETDPCYGKCAACGAEGAVWYVHREWRCYRHREDV